MLGVPRALRLIGFGLAPASVALVLAFGFDPVEWEGKQPLIHRAGGFAGSTACVACHPDQHETWSRTFHRTMTQWATERTVVGAFDGRSVSYGGGFARPFRAEGRFLMEIPDGDAGRRVAEVVLAVGSRRYQQYFERVEKEDGFVFVRLPVLWHIGAERWLHMNTVFLGPDDDNWDAYRSRWNDNCIFCHNTGPRPGETDVLAGGVDSARRFDSHVSDLGIACESCHGPGAEHIERYGNTLRRYRERHQADNPTAIVHPAKLDKRRSVAVCGQCHGQRLPLDEQAVTEWLVEGPSFRSGELLEHHVRPLSAETVPPPRYPEQMFKLRFWGDGTPRLSAYEYQGVVASPCFERGELTCGSCHTMHGGDPRGMIEPRMRGNDACVDCHEKIAGDLRAHTHHEPDGSGSECMKCHMPRMVYGILAIHRSHRIENPVPRRDGELGRPHACTLCHLDRSLLWSSSKMTEWWGEGYEPPRRRRDGAPPELPDAVASMLAGDAVQRAVYAHAAGRADAPLEPRAKAELRAALAATLADGYPSIRWLARNSLIRLEQELPLGMLEPLENWDHTDAATRTATAREMFALLSSGAREQRIDGSPIDGLLDARLEPRMETILELIELQDGHVISIGE